MRAGRADGSIAYRANHAGTRRDLVLMRDKRVMAAAAIEAGRVHAGRSRRTSSIARTSSFASARAIGSSARSSSPDGDKVVFQGLTTGLHLYVRSTGTLRHIGPGTAPAWSPDSTRAGRTRSPRTTATTIVASDLYLYEVASESRRGADHDRSRSSSAGRASRPTARSSRSMTTPAASSSVAWRCSDATRTPRSRPVRRAAEHRARADEDRDRRGPRR